MILVAGSANLDLVVRAPRIPASGETVLGRDLARFPGGKGANQAVACARAGGAATRMLLALGADAEAAQIEASLAQAGVVSHVVRVADRPTGVAFICVDDAGENAITVAPGANDALAPADLPSLAGVSHLLVQLETPVATVAAYAASARAAGARVVLNAAPARPLDAELLALVDVLVVNQGELLALTSAAGIADGLAALAVPCVVVTLGRDGAVARAGADVVRQPAFAVDAVDTTAAGDTFVGAFVAALDAGTELPAALRRASAAAALTCTRLGAQASIPTRAEVERFLHEQR